MIIGDYILHFERCNGKMPKIHSFTIHAYAWSFMLVNHNEKCGFVLACATTLQVATCNPRYIFGLGNGKKGGDLISDTNWHWHCKMYCMLYCDYFSNFVVMKKRTERCVTMIWQTMHMNDVIQIHTVFIIQFWKASKWYHYRISFDFTSLIARLIYHVLLLYRPKYKAKPEGISLVCYLINQKSSLFSQYIMKNGERGRHVFSHAALRLPRRQRRPYRPRCFQSPVQPRTLKVVLRLY